MQEPAPNESRDPAFPDAYARRSARTLETALTHLPAYQPWQSFDPGPQNPIDRRFSALPSTDKKMVRDGFPSGFVLPGRNVQEGLARGMISLAHTSGTTEERVTTIWDQTWWNASEQMSWKLNRHTARIATGAHREALLASPICIGVASDAEDLPMEERIQDRFLFLNEKTDPSRWTADLMDRMVHEINSYRPLVLEANPSFLARLSRHIADRGRKITAPQLIVLSYEFPSRLHYRQFQRAFPAVPISSSYGSTETGYVLTECEAGHFHQNAESCRIDFQPLREALGDTAIGRILVTPFEHPWFSLIRFDIADSVRFQKNFLCPCGRSTGFTFTNLEGRVRDITLTPAGRVVTVNALDAALSPINGLLAYQLQQVSPAGYRLRTAASDDDRAGIASAATDALRRLYGAGAEIEIQPGPDFPPEPSGKYRLAKPMIPIDLDRLFRRDGRIE